jgi:basic membrane lipoprotein Med (substrate-binding protein (PBP1-ABC) superfamily)
MPDACTAATRRFLLQGALALGGVALLAGPAAAFKLEGEPKIAFIYGATAKDGGWNEALDAARAAVEQQLGLTVAVTENVPEEATALKNAIDLYVKRGFNIIVGTTYGYSDGILEAAKQYPDVAFVNASGTTNAPNLEGFYARTYQGWYLAGMAAAGVSKSGNLGILGGFPVGVVNWDVNAFTLGARAIDPDAKVTVVYTNSWWDPVKEGQVTEAMLDQGIDVIANNLSSSAPFIAAEARGVPSVGFQLDMRQHAPKGNLTSVMFRWDEYLVPTIKAIVDGTWQPSEYGAFPGMTEGVVDLAPLSDLIPKEVVAKMDEAKAAMQAGTFSPFQGPIRKQDGSEAVAAGAVLDDGGLWSMAFLVEGTVGTLPAAQ